ncbi:MAG: SDR family NAD(P)-dependent oxidoreductase [Candidatus ainarchaeum sp.]|nr:SDR family NAD(P)-dependent oxidoreductase [Candidatus ainarchaeum sp.]
MFSLKGKTAIITGSDRGIGKGIAIVLAKAGANIVITSRHKEKCEKTASEIEKLGVKTLAIECDVAKEEDVKQLVENTVKKFGKLDIMVNNAGVLLQKPTEEVEQNEWNRIIDINLKGIFLGTKYALKQMKKQKNGNIVNIASIAALKGYPQLSVYCASKGGIVSFTKSVAIEFASQGIRINAILPGAIESDMTKTGPNPEKTLEMYKKQIPIGSIGKPEDIGYGVLYLVSEESKYVTGHSLAIDGGWSVE